MMVTDTDAATWRERLLTPRTEGAPTALEMFALSLISDRERLLGALERNMPKHTLHHDWCAEEPCSCGMALLAEAG